VEKLLVGVQSMRFWLVKMPITKSNNSQYIVISLDE
jgi:hypothetical protein